MAGLDRESTQEWSVPEQGEPGASAPGGRVVGDGDERSPSAAARAADSAPLEEGTTRKRLDWRIEAVAASVDAWAGLAAAVAEELDRVHRASLEAASQGEAAAEIAERAAASAAGAHLLAAERADRVDRAEVRVGELTGQVEGALAKLEAGERAALRRAEQAERDEQSLRSFDQRADRVVQRLRELEQAASVTLEDRRPQHPPR